MLIFLLAVLAATVIVIVLLVPEEMEIETEFESEEEESDKEFIVFMASLAKENTEYYQKRIWRQEKHYSYFQILKEAREMQKG